MEKKSYLIQLQESDLRTYIFDCVDQAFRHHQPLPISQESKDQWLDLKGLKEYHPNKPANSTIYAWVQNLEVPFHKRGGRLYFRKSEIDEWLENGRVITGEEIAAEAMDTIRAANNKGLQNG